MSADPALLHSQLVTVREERDLARMKAADMQASRDEARRVHAAASRAHVAEIEYLHILCEELREENAALRCRLEEQQ